MQLKKILLYYFQFKTFCEHFLSFKGHKIEFCLALDMIIQIAMFCIKNAFDGYKIITQI